MRLLPLLLLASVSVTWAAPFEIKDGDRVLLLGDALLERENTYGYLETRMHEQFPAAKFTVRNLSWSGETPKGWARASFDAPAKGWARLQEQIADVKPTVVFLGFGMAATLQELTDRSGDMTQNPDPVRYGAEPMSAPRFKKELAELMDAINKTAGEGTKVRYVLLSPIAHEQLSARPGLPNPEPHNALIRDYTKKIEELAKERAVTFSNLTGVTSTPAGTSKSARTDNGINLTEAGFQQMVTTLTKSLEWPEVDLWSKIDAGPNLKPEAKVEMLRYRLRGDILRKNDLFFHQFRPANSTYLFGFRKHEQGRNAAEMPKFTPLIEQVDAAIQAYCNDAAAGKAISLNGMDTLPAVDKYLPMPEVVLPKPAGDGQSKRLAEPVNPPPPLPNFKVTDDLEITLWADTDLIGKPVGMNWDAAGRLWVACSPVYPQIAPGAHPDDKVIVLEDTDKDGKADKSVKFASDLLIAAGVAPDFAQYAKPDKLFIRDGARFDVPPAAYVAASTELLRLEDTNGDGVADERRIVFSGFGTEDTHHTIHTLRWGPDGRLYFNQSIYIHSHLETPWGMVRLNSGAICSYDPRTERVEVLARGFVNTWGHAWDQYGQSFATDGAGGAGINWIVPGGMYVTYEGARRILPSVSPGGYPKFCGLELIQSPLFPKEWQGNAITCDFRAHKLSRFQFTDLGQPVAAADGKTSEPKSGYITKELPNPVTTSDASFRPIDVKLGPDGALYIADWTNPIINHGEVDFRDPRRDHIHGRIWRLAPKGSTPVKWESMVGKQPEALLKHLTAGKNLWEREHARRALLTGKHDGFIKQTLDEKRLLPLDTALAGELSLTLPPKAEVSSEPAPNDPQKYIDLLGTTFGVETLAQSVRLQSQSLANSVAAHPEKRQQFEAKALEKLRACILSSHPRVRLEAMRALARIPAKESAELVLRVALNVPAGDSFYEYAGWLSVNDLAPQVVEWVEGQAVTTAASGTATKSPEKRDAMTAYALQALRPEQTSALLAKIVSKSGVPKDGSGPWIELIGQAGGAVELKVLVEGLKANTQATFGTPEASRRAAAALVAAAKRGAKPDGVPFGKPDFYTQAPKEATNDLLRLAGLWKEPVGVVAAKLDPKTEPATLDAVFEALRTLGNEDAAKVLIAQLPVSGGAATTGSPDLRRRALAALAAFRPAPALAALPEVLREDNVGNSATIWRQLFASDKFNAAFLAKAPQLTKEQAAAALRASRELGKRGEKLTAALTPLTADPAVPTMPGGNDIAALVALTKAKGKPEAGELVYRRVNLTCTVCHAIGGAGGKVGPELMTIGASAPLDYIIESTINPAVKIKEGYHAIAVSIKGGQTLSGTVAKETDRELVLRDMVGAEQTIAKATITDRTNIGSLMPPGLTATLNDQEKADLFAFLSQLGKAGPFDASKPTVARSWRIFPGAAVEAVVTGKADAKLAIPVLSYTDGRVTKDLLAPAIQAAPGDTVIAVARFNLASAGSTRLKLQGATKAWLDGAPLAIASDPNPVIELPAGDHTLAIKLDTKALPETLRAESAEARFIID